MQMVIKICHKHNALATGGMVSKILPQDTKSEEWVFIIQNTKNSLKIYIF